jgi:hypothetical protein
MIEIAGTSPAMTTEGQADKFTLAISMPGAFHGGNNGG